MDDVLWPSSSSANVLNLLKCRESASAEESEVLSRIIQLELEILELDTRAIHKEVVKNNANVSHLKPVK